MSKKIVASKDIEVGKKYTVTIPNPLRHAGDRFEFKMLVLAKNRNNLFAFDLTGSFFGTRLPKKDREILTSLKVRDFINNSKEVVQKYEGDGIVHYFIEKGRISDAGEDYTVDFLA